MYTLGKRAAALAATAVTTVGLFTAFGAATANADTVNVSAHTVQVNYLCGIIGDTREVKMDVTLKLPDTVVKGVPFTLEASYVDPSGVDIDVPAGQFQTNMDVDWNDGGQHKGTISVEGLKSEESPVGEPIRNTGGTATVTFDVARKVSLFPSYILSTTGDYSMCVVQGAPPVAAQVEVAEPAA